LKVNDWGLLKKVAAEERYRYLSCTCPPGWRNPTGAGKFSCVRATETGIAPVYVVTNKNKGGVVLASAVVGKAKSKPATVVASVGKGKPVVVAAKGKGKPTVVVAKGKSAVVVASNGKGKPAAVVASTGKGKPKGFLATLFRSIFKPA
jgi:hypothetical protein